MHLLWQASRPWNHVCPNLESPGCPHCPNQAPPPAQQLGLPEFLKIPHFGHIFAETTTAICMPPVQWPGREHAKYRVPVSSKAGDSSTASVPPVPVAPKPDDGGTIPAMLQRINCVLLTSTTLWSAPAAYLNRILSPTLM